ncbi:peptidase U61 LD-carboxypeptidase A [Desulfosudis oleivorans Hxd3]|uniref:Peptidase U61 LD-carboxypeptidase A n=2 Tax=Desulfosudis TaxID=2904716 RepID=A8ZU88_DESOH|nr:peptidase U61 LD-carboxypeptidase A [Desulfosudis oleivorans Hxd3]
MDLAPMSKIKPRALAFGDTIGIAAPAGAFDADRLEKGLSVLQAMGFLVRLPDGTHASQRYLAGTDEHRAAMFNNLFADPEIKAVACARGGFGALRMAPLLDMDAITRHPKIFLGFSDISVLLSILGRKAGLITFHGPVVTSLADADDATIASLADALTTTEPLRIDLAEGMSLVPGTAQGPVAGGNLASLCQMIGTPWQPAFDGCILFLEETSEPAYRVDRMLTQMRLAGCLAGVAGVALGRFDRCGHMDVIFEIVREHLPEGVPVLAGFPVGHNGTNRTLPLGVWASLDAENRFLEYHEPALAR